MTNHKLVFSLTLLVMGALLIFTSCSSNSNETSSEPTTRLISYSDQNINREVTNLTADYNELKAKVDNITDDTKEDVKKQIDQLRINTIAFDEELTQAVSDDKLGKDVKKTYDSFIENMKTNLDTLEKRIN